MPGGTTPARRNLTKLWRDWLKLQERMNLLSYLCLSSPNPVPTAEVIDQEIRNAERYATVFFRELRDVCLRANIWDPTAGYKVDDMSDKELIAMAKQQYHKDGEVEIDESGCVVSRGDFDGAYVEAWVWVGVPDEQIEPDLKAIAEEEGVPYEPVAAKPTPPRDGVEPHAIVFVRGGVVQDVQYAEGVVVEVRDYDDGKAAVDDGMEEGPDYARDEDGAPYQSCWYGRSAWTGEIDGTA